MISIKDTSVLTSVLIGFHPALIDILVWLTEVYNRTVITCGYRPDDSGVHGTNPCRGLDIRSWVFTNPIKVTQHINEMFQYDPERPEMNCAVFHDSGSGNHIHLQVHDNTVRCKNENHKRP